MSTILKALEKSNHSGQTVILTESTDSKWKLMFWGVSSITILLLLTLVFLFFKWNSLVESSNEIKALALTTVQQNTESIELVPEKKSIDSTELHKSNEMLVAENHDKNVPSVSEVYFDTQPLPLPESPKTNTQNLASADKAVKQEAANLAEKSVGSVDSSIDETALEDVSSELQRRFAKAVELEAKGELDPVEPTNIADENKVSQDISNMPIQFQFRVPLMRYDSHVYSTIESDRWIRINGQDLRVGDSIGDVELVDIKPHQSEFSLEGQHFTLESLVDWEG